MATSYFIPTASVVTEQVIKNSRFICSVGWAGSRQEVISAAGSIRNQHPQASHVCWAYIAGPPDSADRGMSDDGEPHGTAGKPMLTILEHSGMGEIWATVTRYYGGIKLGTGGLVRAYSSSVQQAIKLVGTWEKVPMTTLQLIVPYRLLTTIRKIVEDEKSTVINEIFQDSIELTTRVPSQKISIIAGKVAAVSKGMIPLKKI